MLPSIICLLMDFFRERCGCLDSYAANIINEWAGKGNSKKDFEMKGNNPVTDIYFIIVACGEMLFWAIGGLVAAIPQMVASLWGGLNNTFMFEYPVGSQVGLPQICHLKTITIKDWRYSAVLGSSHPPLWQSSPPWFRLFHVNFYFSVLNKCRSTAAHTCASVSASASNPSWSDQLNINMIIWNIAEYYLALLMTRGIKKIQSHHHNEASTKATSSHCKQPQLEFSVPVSVD